ncbi:uncharacterized protein CTHT_0040100 [Thermochaetoides thermophila DSM 1495]|uniref:Uncharacterized protein n=1 Tax=Chaetomium thermophilum (strain DSM 1495 / CBS 144.50 / IMI 039719) TaxID=759272 RepID=G0S8R8_CHATD|nr:hypothetical protein CTHT_0040100 [Thermochaetoides thermophila DSM 1495]EGS20271.1 hypothetical protein CTHT_0040100 [Thermochaetoides thermophila DSM 1495]
MARLTALLIPPLVRKKPSAEPTKTSNLSLIISMSSGAYHGPPWLVMYGATKDSNRSFGIGLGLKLAQDPSTAYIDSLVAVPGEVLSRGNCRGVPSHTPRRDEYGRNVVRKAGLAPPAAGARYTLIGGIASNTH